MPGSTSADVLRDRLVDGLRRDLADPTATLDTLVALGGGNSRTTYRTELVTAAARRAVVVQVRGGAGGGPDEASVLRAASGAGVPVPEVVAGGAGTAVGPDVLVTALVPGEASVGRLLRDPRWREPVAGLPEAVGRAAARIHALPGAVAVAPAVDRLAERLAATGHTRPVVEAALRVLRRRPVAVRGPVVVHGDLRLGNLVVDDDGLAAVLDWEVSHAGEPGEDLGWLLSPTWRRGGDGPFDAGVEAERTLDAYAAEAGWRPDRAELRWWQLHAVLLWSSACMELTSRTREPGPLRPHQVAAGRALHGAERTALALAQEVLADG